VTKKVTTRIMYVHVDGGLTTASLVLLTLLGRN